MATVEARMKVKGKNFEISVDLDEALKVRAGTGNVAAALNSPAMTRLKDLLLQKLSLRMRLTLLMFMQLLRKL